jgi:Protein of unknown function (DUF726).
VAGRLVNAYSFQDKLLSFAYFLATWDKAIGSGPIEVSGIENIDVTKEAGGHLEYRKNVNKVLKAIRYN